MFTSVSTLSIFPTSACSLASLLSRIFSIYRFLTFLIIIDFGFRYGVVPLAQTPYWFGFVPQHSSFCFCSLHLFPALSSSTFVLCDRRLVPVFTIIRNPPLSSFPTPFVRSSASLCSQFIFISFSQRQSLSSMLTTTLLRIYRKW